MYPLKEQPDSETFLKREKTLINILQKSLFLIKCKPTERSSKNKKRISKIGYLV